MSVTAGDITKGALSKLGVIALGETLDGELAADSFDILNSLMESLTTDRMYIVAVSDHVLTVAPNTQSITIGPGCDINVTRPIQLEDRAFFRFVNLDYPMEQVNLDQYNQFTIKNLGTTYPAYYYYDYGFPTGTIKFWPVPIQTCELHLPLMEQLQQFANLTTSYTLPPGYRRFLELAMALELAPNYRPVTADLMRNYNAARRTIQRANLRIPTLVTPPWIQRGTDRRGNGLANFIAGY